MFDYIEYTHEAGSAPAADLEVYALSTCGFCKRALAFLRDNNLPFHYVYMDQLPLDTKTRVKEALKEQFHNTVSFPYLVIDGKRCIVGFIESEWRKLLQEN